MNELLWYAQSEAGHPIFRLMRDMGREANALEGKVQALRVLMEVSFSVVSEFNATNRPSWSGSGGKAMHCDRRQFRVSCYHCSVY